MPPTFISEVAATCECSVSVGASVHFEVSALPSTFVLSGSKQTASFYLLCSLRSYVEYVPSRFLNSSPNLGAVVFLMAPNQCFCCWHL